MAITIKLGLFLILLLTLPSCHENPKGSVAMLSGGVTDSVGLLHLDRIDSTLGRYLGEFIREYDSIRNPWNFSPMYFLTFERSEKDTLIAIWTHVGLLLFPDEEDQTFNRKLIGYVFLDSLPVVIYDFNELGMHQRFIDSTLIRRDSLERLDQVGQDYVPEDWTFVSPKWNLKIAHGDSLYLMSKTK
jgi:hypothetical protein